MLDSRIESQALFDEVLMHLKQQKERATVKGTNKCSYRAPSGLRCAIGCLLKDSEYFLSFEGMSVGNLALRNLLPKRLVRNIKLLEELQYAHDHSENILELRLNLRKIAALHNLSPAKVFDIIEWEYNPYE